MDYLLAGLLFFTIGNLIHLERAVTKLQVEIKHIKESLKGRTNG